MRNALIILIILLLAASAPAGEAKAPARLADQALEATPRECGLLGGCPKGRPLTLASLPGEYLLVEVFSMYCPICQGEADKVNRLYKIIFESGYTDKISVIGMGAGNSRFETDFFQDKFKVPFAMFPDQDMAFYNTLGEPGTPFFILAKKNGGGLEVLFTHRGPFKSADAFFRTIIQKAGLEQ